MIGRSLADSAAREAFEEAGISGKIDPRPLGSFRHIKHGLFGSLEVEILVHPLAVEKELADWPEKRQRSRRWFSLKEAVMRVQSKELRAMMLRLGEQLKRNGR